MGNRREKSGARHARKDAVVGRDDGMEGARRIAGRFLRRTVVTRDEVHLPAARAQALADRRPGEAGANDQCAFFLAACYLAGASMSRNEHFLLVAEPRAFFD